MNARGRKEGLSKESKEEHKIKPNGIRDKDISRGALVDYRCSFGTADAAQRCLNVCDSRHFTMYMRIHRTARCSCVKAGP